jgi:hypothetical protein
MCWRTYRKWLAYQVDDHVVPLRSRCSDTSGDCILCWHYGSVHILLRSPKLCCLWRNRSSRRPRPWPSRYIRRDVSIICLTSVHGKRRPNTFLSASIAVVAYLVGGCAYQRTVMHQRGWRQCPNYSLWAGMFDFVKVSILALIPFRRARSRSRRRDLSAYKESANAKLPISRMD